jgi:hypothetical protein
MSARRMIRTRLLAYQSTIYIHTPSTQQLHLLTYPPQAHNPLHLHPPHPLLHLHLHQQLLKTYVTDIHGSPYQRFNPPKSEYVHKILIHYQQHLPQSWASPLTCTETSTHQFWACKKQIRTGQNMMRLWDASNNALTGVGLQFGVSISSHSGLPTT